MRKEVKKVDKDIKYPRETKEQKKKLPAKARVPVIEAKDLEGKSSAKIDFLVTAVESLLIKGIENPSRIANLLELRTDDVKRYIPMAQKRWEISSGRTTEELYKGVRRLGGIEEEAWKLYDSATNVRDKVACLRLAGDAINTKLDRMGWTPAEVQAYLNKPTTAKHGKTKASVITEILKELNEK